MEANVSGMEVNDARRLRLLENENRKLKKLVADQALDLMVLKELLSKNPKAQTAPHGHDRSHLSLWALFSRLTGWNRSSAVIPARGPRRQRLARASPSLGGPQTTLGRWLHDVLKAEGLVINHKRTERASGEEGLSLRRRNVEKKLPALARVPIPQPERPNQRWSMNFIHDQLSSGRRFRCLTIVDDFTRQCLAIHWCSCDSVIATSPSFLHRPHASRRLCLALS